MAILEPSAAQHPASRHIWRWIGLVVLLVMIGLAIAAIVVIRRATPILKGRVIETLSERFRSRVELDDLQVSILRGLEVSGSGLRIFPPYDVVAAGANAPLISVRSFSFHTGIRDLFIQPMRVAAVHVEGLNVTIPPGEVRRQGAPPPNQPKAKHKIGIQVDEILCDDSALVLQTAKPGKDPKIFILTHIVLHDFGPNSPWPYEAQITNAIPEGKIHATGHFGPWNVESPGDSPLDGHYTFDKANLYPIKGIGGVLSSVGDFTGQLNKIGVQGTARVPNFSLDSASHPMPLDTTFSAVVDGTSGDTYLQHVDALLGHSRFTCNGEIVNVKGQGHIIDLDLDVPAGRIEDFLQLAVKTQPVIMTGVFGTRSHIHIPPGKESVTHKLNLKGHFTLHQVRFTNPAWQQKVDELSARAEGRPEDAKPGAAIVASQMNGVFQMTGGRMDFSNLNYTIPGAAVVLEGVYTLDGKTFDFHGKVRTQARASQMVVTPWKSWLLKAVDPFLARNGAGLEVPFKVSGTNGEPKFGLDFGHKDKDDRLANPPPLKPR